MDIVFTIFKYFVFGFFFLIVLMFFLAAVFGKRVKKKWEYEAEFRNEAGREIGELDITMSRIEKEEPDFTFKADFCMRHSALTPGTAVQVFVDDFLVMEGEVEQAGRIALDQQHIANPLDTAAVGQMCRVELGNGVQFSAPLEPD